MRLCSSSNGGRKYRSKVAETVSSAFTVVRIFSQESLKAIAFHRRQLQNSPPNAFQYMYQLNSGSGRAASPLSG
ncbi:hypothetical protein VTK26DRAFT_687 [Humicola hyalothermophila]